MENSEQTYNHIMAKYDMLISDIQTKDSEIEELQKQAFLLDNSKQFLVGFSEYSREKIKWKLENIVNSALNCIYQDKIIKFKILPNKTKRGLQYDVYVETNGSLTPITDAKGGGVMDVVAISLKIAFLRLYRNHTRQVMILDEPFKYLDDQRIHLAVEWLKTISEKMGIQFLIVSHEDAIIQNSNKVYMVKQINGKSEIRLS
jgi:DNA repair exonuclease SbcCD ATPase subunit